MSYYPTEKEKKFVQTLSEFCTDTFLLSLQPVVVARCSLHNSGAGALSFPRPGGNCPPAAAGAGGDDRAGPGGVAPPPHRGWDCPAVSVSNACSFHLLSPLGVSTCCFSDNSPDSCARARDAPIHEKHNNGGAVALLHQGTIAFTELEPYCPWPAACLLLFYDRLVHHATSVPTLTMVANL